MKILIQEIPTRRYYQHPGVWTGDVQRASDFRTSSAALEFATRWQLRNVQVVITSGPIPHQVFPLRRSIRTEARPT